MADDRSLFGPRAAPEQRGAGRHGVGGRLQPAGLRQIAAFRGFGNADQLHIQGRVHASAGREAGGRFSFRRDRASFLAPAEVTLQCGSRRQRIATDRNGLYAATLTLDAPPARHGWRSVSVIADAGYGASTASHRVLVPAAGAGPLILCDLDDTGPANHEARNRSATLPSLGALCAALWRGPESAPLRPLFVLSGIHWRRYNTLADTLRQHRFPVAPILMHPAPGGYGDPNSASKHEHLSRVLDCYPDTQVVLISSAALMGDSGIRSLFAAHATRFSLVLLRGRRADARALRLATGVPACAGQSALTLARHARRRGLCSDSDLARLANL